MTTCSPAWRKKAPPMTAMASPCMAKPKSSIQPLRSGLLWVMYQVWRRQSASAITMPVAASSVTAASCSSPSPSSDVPVSRADFEELEGANHPAMPVTGKLASVKWLFFEGGTPFDAFLTAASAQVCSPCGTMRNQKSPMTTDLPDPRAISMMRVHLRHGPEALTLVSLHPCTGRPGHSDTATQPVRDQHHWWYHPAADIRHLGAQSCFWRLQFTWCIQAELQYHGCRYLQSVGLIGGFLVLHRQCTRST